MNFHNYDIEYLSLINHGVTRVVICYQYWLSKSFLVIFWHNTLTIIFQTNLG